MLLLVEGGLILADAVAAVVNMVAMMVKVNAFKFHLLRSVTTTWGNQTTRKISIHTK